MSLEGEPSTSQLTPETHPISHVIVEEVLNSQNPNCTENDYDPLISQSQHLSQAGPSNWTPQSADKSQTLTEYFDESCSVTKRRGRPSKQSLLQLKPTRGSERVKKPPKVLTYEKFHNSRSDWSEEDKELFLAGCLKVGIEDIEGLQRFLPHKSKNDIRNQIRMWKELSYKSVENDLFMDNDNDLPVEAQRIKNLYQWINNFKEKAKSSNTSNFTMSNFFLLAAEYDEFPDPEKCGGIDFRAMYRYIHCLMNGIPPYGLNRVTSRVLHDRIGDVLEKLDDPALIDNLQEYLFNTPDKPPEWTERFGKTYCLKDMNARPIDEILKNPVFNPLNLPKDALGWEINNTDDSENSD